MQTDREVWRDALRELHTAAYKVWEIHRAEMFGDPHLTGDEWGEALRELEPALRKAHVALYAEAEPTKEGRA